MALCLSIRRVAYPYWFNVTIKSKTEVAGVSSRIRKWQSQSFGTNTTYEVAFFAVPRRQDSYVRHHQRILSKFVTSVYDDRVDIIIILIPSIVRATNSIRYRCLLVVRVRRIRLGTFTKSILRFDFTVTNPCSKSAPDRIVSQRLGIIYHTT